MPEGMIEQNPGKGKTFLDLKQPNFDIREPSQSSGRSFDQIKSDLWALKDNPDSNRERELRIERSRLINEAKDVGVLDGIKRQLLDIQTNNFSIIESATLISQINTPRLEDEARGLSGWTDNFEGLMEEYKQGALRNMTLAYLKKVGAPQRDIDKVQREIEVANWGSAPSIIDTMPIQPELTKQQFGFTARELAREMAAEQGIVSPYNSLKEAVDGEEFLKTAQRIVPGQEPRFWVVLDNKEKDEWVVRSTLWIIAVKKSAAFSSDKLCMAEMHDLAVDLNKWALQVLWGEVRNGELVSEGKDGVLPATGIYTTIIGDPKFLNYKDRNDLSLKQVFFDGFRLDDQSLQDDYGSKGLQKLTDMAKTLRAGCPDSFYPHSKDYGTTIDAEGFKTLRKSIRFWLTTQGRDLLLTEDEKANRESFFENKSEALETLEFRAREAEVIAWNFVYAQGLLETFDTREYRPEGTKRHGPSAYWSLALWTVMHLQERFEQKVIRGNNSTEMEAKEEWANNLGTWALANYEKGTWTKVDAAGNETIEIPKVLPDVLFRSGLFNKFLYESGREPDGRPSTRMDNDSLFTLLNGIGNDVLFNTANISRQNLVARIPWNKISDTPFVSYIWDEIRWGNVIEQIFKKGQKADADLRDFGEATRNLRLSKETREKMLMIYYGIDVNSSKIKPKEGWLNWQFTKRGLKEFFPNLFLKN